MPGWPLDYRPTLTGSFGSGRRTSLGPVRRDTGSLQDIVGSGFIERGESFAELVTPSGKVLQATATLHSAPLLTSAEATRASTDSLVLDRSSVPGLDEPARLLASPINRNGDSEVLVVGDTRENGIETLRRVRTQLFVGLPLLLLLTGGGGYLLSGAALRPVERMRRRAAELSGEPHGRRLPVPAGSDEIARLGITLNAMLARVDATLERERAFVAHASHELRTPLALLRTELELAIRRPRSADELTAAIGSATDEVDRLIRLAENLLLIADGDADGSALLPVDVKALLAGIAARFHTSYTERGRSLTVGAVEVEMIRGDPHRLEQAVLNLVANALQHGAGGVEVSAHAVSGGAAISVVDDGPGLAPDMLERGFTRFVRSPSSSGSGLGLAVVAAIARRHGGSAGASSRPEGGAEVWMWLPLSPRTYHSRQEPALAGGSRERAQMAVMRHLLGDKEGVAVLDEEVH